EETAAARKLAKEVLQLYGLEAPDKGPDPVIVGLPQSCCGLIPSATIIVHVPANAKLFFNGEPTNSTGETRSFWTPPLRLCRSYSYTIKKVTLVDGKEVVDTKLIPVQAFSITDVDFR